MRPEELGFGGLFERVQDAVIVADARTQRVVLWNPAATAIFGYALDEALQLRVDALVPDELKARHRAGIARYAETGHGAYIDAMRPLELPAIGKDGVVREIELSFGAIGSVSGARGGERLVLAIVREISGRKRAEREIRRLNETLERRVAERTAQLADRERRLTELLGRLVAAQEEERRRVAYEVHDGLAQMLVAVQQHLDAFAKHHPPGSPRGRADLGRTLDLAREAVRETRQVIAGLRPTALDDHGLAAALRLQVDAMRAEGREVAYREGLGGARLPAAIETTLYRVAQEALTNARKHAGPSRVRIALRRSAGRVHLRVRDWGLGFAPGGSPARGCAGEGVGIAGMTERVTLLGGVLTVRGAPGGGTLVAATVPLPDQVGEGRADG